MSKDIELNKLRMLVNAIETVEQEEAEPDFYDILKEAAWNVLHENPGSEFGDWQNMLLEQYPSEVVDALGTNPEDVFSQLADWWCTMTYKDEITGIEETFCNWAEYFANDRSVELYDMFVDAKRK